MTVEGSPPAEGMSRRTFLVQATALGVAVAAAPLAAAHGRDRPEPNHKENDMDLQLKGKRALVTGSTSGIGEGVAKLLAAQGVAVVVHGRNEARGKAVVKAVTDAGGRAALALGDLRSDDQAKRVAAEAVAAFGGVDILVNNAGEFLPVRFMDATPADWLALYDNNAVSQVRMARLLLPQMRDRKWGRVINVSSRGGTMSGDVAGHYSATKAANVNLTLTLADTLKNTGVTANTVSPGEVDTPGARRFFALALGLPVEGFTWEMAEEHGLRGGKWVANAVGRYGKVSDIAPVVAFVASPLADWITGQNFHVDGGSTRNFY